MSRITKASQPAVTPQQSSSPAWKQKLPTDRACQLYPRVSTPAQKKNVSAEMQKDKTFALQCGWRDELVIIDDRDLGVSGQLRMEDRVAFNAMNTRIMNGEIAAVVVVAVDRLFRERWGVEYSKFMQLCERYGVLVVTNEFVYDFSISWHVDKFRRKCEEAWNYIEYHVLGKMLPARDHQSKKGYAVSGGLAIGYVIDRTARDKKPIPYPPHASKVPTVFEMFRDCGGVLGEVQRRLIETQFLFPAFDASIEEEVRGRCKLTRVYDEDGALRGYRFGNITGLRSFLSNPMYIGAWCYQGVLLDRHNHDGLVDEDLFFYAFNKLSPTLLSGDINPIYLERIHTYAKKRSTDGKALVRDVLEAGEKETTIYAVPVPTGKGVYYQMMNATSRTYLASEFIDAVVIQRLLQKLQQAGGFENYQDYNIHEQDRQEALHKTYEDITSTQGAMTSLKEKVKLLHNLDLLDALEEQYTHLTTELERLIARKDTLTQTEGLQQQRQSYKELLLQIGEGWPSLPAKHLFTCIELFIDRVVLTMLSPRIYTLEVTWADPDWGSETAVCVRDRQGSLKWSQEERALLQTHWPRTAMQEIRRLLPGRNYISLQVQARRDGVKREVMEKSVPLPGWSYQDIQTLERLGVTIEEDLSDSKLVSWSLSPSQITTRKIFSLPLVIARLTSILAN